MALEMLQSMGFDQDVATQALLRAGGNPQAAVEMLLNPPTAAPPTERREDQSSSPAVSDLVAMGFEARDAEAALEAAKGNMEQAVAMLVGGGGPPPRLPPPRKRRRESPMWPPMPTMAPEFNQAFPSRPPRPSTWELEEEDSDDEGEDDAAQTEESKSPGRVATREEAPDPPDTAPTPSSASAESLPAPAKSPSPAHQGTANEPPKELLTTERMAATLAWGPAAFGKLQATVAASSSSGDAPGVPGASNHKNLHAKIPKMLKASVPGVGQMRGERGLKTVTQMISDCYVQGLFMHGPPQSPVNCQIIPALHHIFAEMASLPATHAKRVNCLTALAEACQDCQQVQAREILRLYGDLTAQNETFERQLLYSLLRQKEAALNRLISLKHKNCDFDHTRVQPWQQRAHLWSAYVSILGDEFGFEGVVAAKSDRFLPMAVKELGKAKKNVKDLILTLQRDMSIKEWLQTLLADINNQAPAVDRLINRDCIFKWAQQHMSQEEAHLVFYDEERAAEFADHDPKEPTTENRYQPFLSCQVLVKMLIAGKMVQDAPEGGVAAPAAAASEEKKRPKKRRRLEINPPGEE